MCSRYCLTSSPAIVQDRFQPANQLFFPPRYNIAPTQPVAILRHNYRGIRELQLVRWGLIPSWVKQPTDFPTIINARSETAAQKPSFRAAIRYRRCIVPADGFYEWTGPKGAKQPHLIRSKPTAQESAEKSQKQPTRMPLAMAGLWETWLGADGSEIETMAVLTTCANATMADIHDRMPVLLAADDFDRWLDCSNGLVRDIGDLLAPAPADLLEIKLVNPELNNSRNEGAQLHVMPSEG